MIGTSSGETPAAAATRVLMSFKRASRVSFGRPWMNVTVETFGQSEELLDYADKTKGMGARVVRPMDRPTGGTHNRSHDAWER